MSSKKNDSQKKLNRSEIKPVRLLVPLSILVIALFVFAAFTSCSTNNDDSSNPETSPSPMVGDINKFISNLEGDNFISQEGTFQQVDLLKLCSEGFLAYCFGNNAGGIYIVTLLPPAPNQKPAQGQNPPVGYNPDNPNNYPPNIDAVPPGIDFKLRPDEAMVMIGKTPPKARYFSYRTYIGFTENKPGKDYSDVFTVGNDEVGYYHRIFASLGDPLNQLTMNTVNTPNGAEGDAFNSYSIIISSADKGVCERVKKALVAAGYSESIINVDIIPSGMVNMGLEKGKDTFMMLHRAALWDNPEEGQYYMDHAADYMRVFRVTPNGQITQNPYPVPTLKTRGTGVSEYQIIPNAAQDLETLRVGLLNKYATSDYTYKEMETDIWIPEGYVGIAQDFDVLAEDRDTTYLKTETFQFNSDDDFVIVYGINHQEAGKAIYSNFSFYGWELINGVAGTNSSVFDGSAAEYFPAGYANAKYYYAYKLARQKATPGENCIVVEKSTDNPKGKAFGVDNNKDSFIAFRAYIEKETEVGPAPFELIYDSGIIFHKK